MASQRPPASSVEQLYNFPAKLIFVPALKAGILTGKLSPYQSGVPPIRKPKSCCRRVYYCLSFIYLSTRSTPFQTSFIGSETPLFHRARKPTLIAHHSTRDRRPPHWRRTSHSSLITHPYPLRHSLWLTMLRPRQHILGDSLDSPLHHLP